MSKNFACIDGGVVVNIILGDDDIFVNLYKEQNPTQLCVEYVESDINDENVARIGEHYVDGKFVTPYVAPSVPTSITKVQTMLQLKALGLWETFKAFLASNDDANDIWVLAVSVDRDNSFVPIIAQVVGWDDSQTDNFFIEGAKL